MDRKANPDLHSGLLLIMQWWWSMWTVFWEQSTLLTANYLLNNKIYDHFLWSYFSLQWLQAQKKRKLLLLLLLLLTDGKNTQRKRSRYYLVNKALISLEGWRNRSQTSFLHSASKCLFLFLFFGRSFKCKF